MKKFYLLIATMFCSFSASIQAQTVNNDEEITVTNEKGKTETIDLPEAMTNEVDSLLHLYHSKKYLKKNKDCNLPDFNPTFTPDEFKERLKRLPTVMEMPYNDVVRKFIDRYSNKLRQSVSIMLGASNFYIPIFEQALETYQLPLELKYLPIIESGLNPKAVSHVGATGLWQFMLATAKNYGLVVNSLVDERCDPIKSSYAAANYLSDLYKIYGDWNLVIAAYNCGPNKVSQAIRRAKGSKDYWKIYPYLPRETRGYVPAFIAANYIMTYHWAHNICPMEAELPSQTDTLMIDRDVHFEQIATVLNMDINQIKALNPQYRRNIINGNSMSATLRLPIDMINSFIDNEDSIYNYKADELLTKRDIVEVDEKSNDTPVVKRSYQSTKKAATSKKNKSTKRNKSVRGKYTTVKNGDTLSEIAARNNTTVKKLKKLNGIKGNSIRKGQKLKVK